jgi:Xaa-Pro aminopeptidase
MITDFYVKLPKVLGFELDVVTVNDFRFYCQLFPEQNCVDASSLIHKIRMIKSAWDIEQMEEAAELSFRTFEYIRENIKPGYTEMEFAGMFETFARKFGHGAKLRSRNYQTEAYPWHILSGNSGGMVGVLDSPFSGEGTSLAFPSGGGNKKLAPNEPILIDLGTVLNGYHFDETRMFAIKNMPKKAYDACMASIEIHNEVLDKVKPGVSLEELFNISVAKADSLGYSDTYLGPSGYKVTFIGHGIGLELVEEPIIASKKKDLLETGMMFALEPKLTFENEFAAGIESVFLVTETGHRLISRVPVKIFIC